MFLFLTGLWREQRQEILRLLKMSFVSRKSQLRRYYPKPFYNVSDGTNLAILLDIFGDKLDSTADEVKNMRDQFLLARAFQKYLNVHGVNVDVFRPRGYNMTDPVYRDLIRIVTNSKKNIERIFELIIKLFFGDNALSDRLVNVYSVTPNEMIVRLKENALIIAANRGLLGTTFLHRDPSNAFDGESLDLFTGTLPITLAIGSTTFDILTLPTGMPLEGTLQLNDPANEALFEVKRFTRVGTQITFVSPTSKEHVSGVPLQGAKFPDDYPSGYVYDAQTLSDLVGSFLPGTTSITIGTNASAFPLEGTVYIGQPTSINFESLGYTRSGSTLTLKGDLDFSHASGDPVVLPNLQRKFNTPLSIPITAGTNPGTLIVVNGADFPLQRAAVKLNWSFKNEEIVPFISRRLGDNTILDIDPDYTFINDHAAGEKVTLMSRQTAVERFGLQYPFYLDDTEALKKQFFILMQRLKVSGVRIKFETIQ